MLGYLRKLGVKVSEEQEKYLVDTVRGLVQKQARGIYNQVKKDPDLLSKGIFTENFGAIAKQNLVTDVLEITNSDKFKGFSKNISKATLNSLVEKYVSEENRRKWKLTEEKISQFVDLATASVVYTYNIKQKWSEVPVDVRKELEDKALKEISDLMDEQMLLFSDDATRVRIRAKLGEKLTSNS